MAMSTDYRSRIVHIVLRKRILKTNKKVYILYSFVRVNKFMASSTEYTDATLGDFFIRLCTNEILLI